MALEITIHSKLNIPNADKPKLAELMQDWERKNHKLPPAALEYYTNQLETIPELEFDNVWGIAKQNNQLIGYFKLEWKISGSNLNRSSLMLHFVDGHDKIINYQTLIATASKHLPDYTTIIEFWIPEDLPLDVHFKERKIEPSFIERISVSQIRRHFKLKEIQEISKEGSKKLGQKEFEILKVYDADFDGIDFGGDKNIFCNSSLPFITNSYSLIRYIFGIKVPL